MWDDAKQSRLNSLRDKEEHGALDAAEEQELASLYSEIDAEESARLGSAMERMDGEIDGLRRRNDQLVALAAKRRQLSTRMRSQIAEWLDEHERLEAEAGSLVAAGGSR